MPVLDDKMLVVGIVGTGDLVKGYRAALRQSIRNLGAAGTGAVLVEEEVKPGSPAEGRTIGSLGLPRSTVVVTVMRGKNLLFADAATLLHKGDLVSVVTRPARIEMLRHLLTGPAEGHLGGPAEAGEEPDHGADDDAEDRQPGGAMEESDEGLVARSFGGREDPGLAG